MNSSVVNNHSDSYRPCMARVPTLANSSKIVKSNDN